MTKIEKKEAYGWGVNDGSIEWERRFERWVSMEVEIF